jgi:O-antigen ligase
MIRKCLIIKNQFKSLSAIEKIACAFPFFAILGSAFVNLFYILIILTSLVYYRNSKVEFQFNKNFVFYFIIPYLIILLSYLFSDYKNFSNLLRSLFSFKFLILPFIFIFFVKNKFFFKVLGFNSFIISAFLGCDIFFQFFFGYDFFGIKPLIQNRYSGFLGEEFVAGSFISFFFIYIFLYFILDKSILKKYLFIILISTFFLLVIIITGERLAFLRYSFLLIFIYIFYPKKIKTKIISLVAFTIILANIFIFNKESKIRVYELFFFFGLNDKVIEYNSNFGKLPKDSKLSNSPWVSHWKTSYLIFKDHKITGVGLKNFRQACKEEKYQSYNILANNYASSCTTHPHNVYLEIATELGLIGLLYFFYILFIFFKNFKNDLINNLNKNKNCVLFSLIFFFSSIPFLPSGSIFSSYSGGILFFMISTFIVFKKNDYIY